MQLQPRKFSYRGALPEQWLNPCPVNFTKVDTEQVYQWLQSVRLANVPDISTLMLACPLCNCAKECVNHTLLRGTTWCPIACPQAHCSRVRAFSKWKCECNMHCFLCSTHGPIGHVAGMAKRRRQSIKRTSVSNQHATHCNHQPSAPELLMPAEPVPKRFKVGASNGIAQWLNSDRASARPRHRVACSSVANSLMLRPSPPLSV